MDAGQQQESELQSTDVTKWIENSLYHMALCLKKGKNAPDFEKWPEPPDVLKTTTKEEDESSTQKKEDGSSIQEEDGSSKEEKEDVFSTIKSIISKWDGYWESCIESRRVDVQQAIIQTERLISKNFPTNLRGILQKNYHRGMMKDPAFIAIQAIWNKLSNGSPFTDVITEKSTNTEYSCLEMWFPQYLRYTKSVLNGEAYFVEDLIPKPPRNADKKIIQNLKKIVEYWNKLWLSKFSDLDDGSTKYIEAIYLIFVIGFPEGSKGKHWKKLGKIVQYFINLNAEKTEDPYDAFKAGIYETMLDVLGDRVNIDVIKPPPLPDECDENLKEQLNAQFQTALEALKKKVNISEDLERCKREAEEKIRQLEQERDREVKSRELQQQVMNLKSEIMEKTMDIIFSSAEQCTLDDVQTKYPADVRENIESWLQKMKSFTKKFQKEKSEQKSCKREAEEKIRQLEQERDREVKSRELEQQVMNLKSEIMEKTMDSIFLSDEQCTLDDVKTKYPADVRENIEPWLQKMTSFTNKIRREKSEQKSVHEFKFHTLEGVLTALKNNTIKITVDINAELEKCDQNTREDLRKWYQKVQKRLECMLHEKEKTRREFEHLKQKQAELEENREQLLNRLSQIAGSKLKENNPNITDLSDPNRPLKLAEQFSELYDKEWTNTLEELGKDKMEEKSAVHLLLGSITNCYQFCLKNSEQSLKNFLMCDDSDWRNALDADEHHLFSETRKSLAKVHIRQIQQKFLKENKEKEKTQKNLSKFVEKSLELCWYMVIQNPPIHMEVHFPMGAPLIKSILKEYTISGDTISYLVWPPLYLHKGGPLLSKGVAQPKPKQRRERHTERPSTART